MAERRVINFIKLPDGETLQIGGSSGGSTYGIQGYYSTHYGIENCQYGLIDITDQDLNIITVKGGMMLDMPGATTRVTIGSDITKQLDSATSFTLFYSSGELLEAGRVYYQLDEPTTEEEIENYFAWFNPTFGKWQFKSNDTGNVWRELVATPIADITLNNEVITKIDYIGYRILNNDIYATLEDNQHVATEVEELAEELGSVSNEKANRSLDNLTEAGEAVLRRNTFSMFDIKILDHRLMGGEEERGWMLQGSYVYKESMYENNGYPTFYAKCVEEKSEATPTETTLGDYTVTLYVHPKGHIFYDIADKEAIDAWYNTYGTAWYYGVDINAERIFLPRDDYFYFTGKAMGNGMTLGLTNGENNIGLCEGASNYLCAGTGQYGTNVGVLISGNPGDRDYTIGVTTDPDKSGIVLEANKNKYLYICVGNTTVNEALTDVTDITSSENDTLPLGYSTYQADNLSSLAWLKSTGFFESGLTYVSFYNEYRTRIGEKFSGGYVRSVDDTYTDYDLVIDEANQMFRLPLLDGSESLAQYENSTDVTPNQDFICPDNGYIMTKGGTGDAKLTVNGVEVTRSIVGVTGDYYITNEFAVKKGDVVNGTFGYLTFYPNVGNGSLYYKVANAVQHLEVIDMLHQAELNKPFFYGMYQYFQTEPNNASWLASLGQWNSKGIYTDYYNWILGNANESKEYFKLSTQEYTDYDWVVNTTDETFRLPIKVKLASGKAVVGNGLGLGFEAPGSDIFYVQQNFFVTSSNHAMNRTIQVSEPVEVNATATSSYLSSGGVFGVTTDPTKSGIETSDSDLYLYFYVGEVLQSANLINAGRALEKLSKVKSYKIGFPDYTAGTSITLTVGSTITIPYDCMLWLESYGSSIGAIHLKLNDANGVSIVYFASATTSVVGADRVYLRQGTKVYVAEIANLRGSTIFPLKGAN